MSTFSIESLDQLTKIEIKEALVGEILTTESEKAPSQSDIEKYPFMEGTVYFEELDDDHVGVILSAQFAHTWELGERLSEGPDQPIAIQTAFGWGLVGANGDSANNDVAINCCAVEPSCDIDRVLRYDFIARGTEVASPEQEHPSREDLHAIEQFHDTIRFDESIGHFRCGLPWKQDRASAAKIINQLDTAANAKNRLRKAAERMKREPARKEGVWNQVQEFLNEGHAREVVNPEVADGIPVYHLPLHIVTRPDKPGKW